MGELERYQRIKTFQTVKTLLSVCTLHYATKLHHIDVRSYDVMAVHLNLRFIVDSQLLTVAGRDVLQPGPGYLAGDQFLHCEATTRILSQNSIILK